MQRRGQKYSLCPSLSRSEDKLPALPCSGRSVRAWTGGAIRQETSQDQGSLERRGTNAAVVNLQW